MEVDGRPGALWKEAHLSLVLPFREDAEGNQ